jgi:DNA repair protein RAD50
LYRISIICSAPVLKHSSPSIYHHTKCNNHSLPLTIIVGANGCGKTTIIESLKYVVTGSFPPGVTKGQSFVHDPRSIGQSSVKANIKLRFNNTEGSSMVVVRSMEVTQKKATASFKALDGTIRTVNRETGERVTLSHKCSELDMSIPIYLGVSKPILEHVMFCHQEDSSWPLKEGAELKKRFDDIFDSTRYAKALDAIKAEKKTYAALAKDLKAELEGLNSHKFAACGFREELEDCKVNIYC